MNIRLMSTAGAIILALIVTFFNMIESVKTGYEAVGTRFGKVTGDVLGEGIHIVDPLKSWTHYSTLKQTTLFKQVEIPAKDQQKATIDISVQWRLKPGFAKKMKSETGNEKEMFNIHFIPNARAAFRDAGRTIVKVEMFYDDLKIAEYKAAAIEVMRENLDHVGIEVFDVLVRDVSLPPNIAAVIESKKTREQEVEREKAELEKIKLTAQQKVVQAQADLDASRLDAQATMVRAEAEAFAIQKVTQSLNRDYVTYVGVQAWDGKVPMYSSGGDIIPFLQVK